MTQGIGGATTIAQVIHLHDDCEAHTVVIVFIHRHGLSHSHKGLSAMTQKNVDTPTIAHHSPRRDGGARVWVFRLLPVHTVWAKSLHSKGLTQ